MTIDPSSRVFQDRRLPQGARLAGLAALVQAMDVKAPVRRPSCVSNQHVHGSRKAEGEWTVFDKRYWPGELVGDHLSFALRHEEIDLLVLKRIFDAAPVETITTLVRGAPSGAFSRRLWFFYETLTGSRLDIEDAPRENAVDALDPESYITAEPRLSKRHRVRDNLLGGGQFCPLIRRTPELDALCALDLSSRAGETIARTGAHLLTRAASFLLLADSRASFAIEGERPPRNRLERWGRAVSQAGTNRLTLEEIDRLHHVLIEDNRFIRPGLRPDGVFLGERDHFGEPMPEFIGARPEDLSSLLAGLVAANDRMSAAGVDPVLQAAATAFGFVYVHPFQDGNGRMHRCLIHHVLAERGFAPPGIVFPVSSVMLDRIGDYRATLRAHSKALMPFIEWRPTLELNVETLNDTADLYRFFDATENATFLYECVARTVEHDLPREIDYLRRHDQALRRIMDVVEMPDRVAENLILYIRQNGGSLPKRRREGEFQALTDQEAAVIEGVVREAFGDG